MIILNCHIENFGKLHDLSIDFTEKENLICQENGWGKSTLTAFIRAMFYGLEGEGRRTYEGCERMQYTPWQGGAFGGSITFRANEKTYTLTRMFHEKNNFELRETETNKISHDYSENIGEELFKINRESFVKTVFIGQNDCETKTTDDIHAKIGNITENSNDMNSFETATASLTKVMSSLNPNRVTGSVSRRANEITELERKVLEGSTLTDSMEQYQVRLNEEQEQYDLLKIQVQEIGKEQELVTKWQAIQTKVETYEERAKAFALSEEQQTEFYQLENTFRDGMPQDDEISQMRQKAERLKEMREQHRKEQLSLEEEHQLSVLEERFLHEDGNVTTIAEKWNARNAKKAALPSNQAAFNALKASMELSNQKTMKGTMILGVGVLATIIGIVLSIVQMMIPGAIIVAVGAVMILLGIIMQKKEKRPKSNPQDVAIQEMHKQIEEDTYLIQQIEEEVMQYLKKHGKACEEFVVGAMLQEITKDYIAYTNLLKRREQLSQSTCKEESETISCEIHAFLKQFLKDTLEERYVDDLYQIRHKRDSYISLKQRIEQFQQARLAATEVKKELATFEKDHQITEEQKQTSISVLNEKIVQLTDDMDRCRRAIDGYNRNLDELHVKVDEWEENKNLLQELRQIQEKETKKYEHVAKAKLYLALAKESITQKYAGPILDSFLKYYGMICDTDTRKFYIDVDTKITVEECGKQRETKTQSIGYKDLMGICLRIAFIDAMYKEEKPVLIMDDPFVNMDDKKQEKAMELLKKVAEEYQIIYFTCSSSRSA